MAYRHDFYVHLDENLKFEARLLSEEGAPLVLDDYTIEMAISLEPDTPTIVTLDYPNVIKAVDANTGVIGVSHKLTANDGFNSKDHYYQLRVTNISTEETRMMLEGRLFITDSLFD